MKNEKLLLYILAAIQFTHIMDFMIVMPLGSRLTESFGISTAEFGMIVSAYTISAGIFGFAGAFFIDRFDRRTALLFMYVGFVAGTLACAFAPDYYTLLATRAFTGAFGGITGSIILAIVGDVIPNERRASAMGIVMAAFSVASVFGVPFGLYIANLYDWHAPFLFLGAIGGLITLLIFWQVPSITVHMKGQKADNKIHPIEMLSDIARNGNQMRALLLTSMMMLGAFTVIPYIAQYTEYNIGFNKDQVTYLYLLGGGLTIFTSPLIGKLADRIGRLNVFIGGVVLTSIVILTFTNLQVTPIWITLIVTTALFVASGGRMIPAMAMVTSTVKPRNRGSFMSINSSVQQLSAGLASFVAGLIIYQNASGQYVNYAWVGVIAAVFSLGSIFVARTLKVVDEKEVKTDILPIETSAQKIETTSTGSVAIAEQI